MREDPGVWNSFTTVRNLTNLIVGTDRRLLSVIVRFRSSGLGDNIYLTLVRVNILLVAPVARCAACSILDGVIGILQAFNPSSRAMV